MWPSLYAREAAALGVRWPRGLLLHGPPGCGKSAAVHAAAADAGAALHVITAATVVGAFTGESERRLREAFAAAAKDAAGGRPVLILLDEASQPGTGREWALPPPRACHPPAHACPWPPCACSHPQLDTLCPRRDASRQHEARIVGQLLTLLDGAAALGAAPAGAGSGSGGGGRPPGHILVVGATNRPNAVDPALRRAGRSAAHGGRRRRHCVRRAGHAGSLQAVPSAEWPSPSPRHARRLEREIAVGVPDAAARAAILRLLTRELPLDASVDLPRYAWHGTALVAGTRPACRCTCPGPSAPARAACARSHPANVRRRLAHDCHGYTGADLSALCREAAMRAVAATMAGGAAGEASGAQQHEQQAAVAQQHEQQASAAQQAQAQAHELRPVTAADFAAAMRRVGPSMARGAAVELDRIRW